MTATLDVQMIPVRALNQVTYCPRLYYLQYVDAVMPTNEHVEGGLFDHRRVDDAELANKTRKEGDANRSRGVHLSSETLGISGILDVMEEKDGGSCPVETKHGSAPRDDDGRPTTWDNDAVQLCGQALLMEEAFGKPVERGFQFYAGSRERVEVRFTEELQRRRAQPSTSAGGYRSWTRRRTRCRRNCGTVVSAVRWPRSVYRKRRFTRSACRRRRRRRPHRPA